MSDITDITWVMMSNAGIDINLVKRRPTQLGTDEYILINGDTKVAFGPVVNMQDDEPTTGWDVAVYQWIAEGDAPGDGYWDGPVRQHYAGTSGETLRLVAAEG